MKRYILIQGPINRNDIHSFYNCLDQTIAAASYSIKIIVSTWTVDSGFHNTLKEKYPKVKFIFSAEPSALISENSSQFCNMNKMLLSTKEGLEEIPEDDAIVMKIRTDSYIKSITAFDIFHHLPLNYPIRDDNFKVFDSRILNCNLFARNANSHLPFLFHPGDIMMVGLRKDLQRLFKIKPASNDIFKDHRTWRNSIELKYVPEQYIFLSAIRDRGYSNSFKGNFHYDTKLIASSERFMMNNYYFLSANTLDFEWPKYKTNYFKKGWSSIYDFNDWKIYNNRTYGSKYESSICRYRFKKSISNLTKIYFIIRTQLLRNKRIKTIAMNFFAKR